MAVKYKDYLEHMYAEHLELFEEFSAIHHEYQMNQPKYQAEFNRVGVGVMRVVEEWENRLCNQMEKGKHSAYSLHLADKFREAIRAKYPLIDFVGAKVTKPIRAPQSDFDLPYIKLD